MFLQHYTEACKSASTPRLKTFSSRQLVFLRGLRHNAGMNFPVRVNKYLADQGVASRREIDALIESGKVLINGHEAALGQKVNEGDEVEVIGKPVKKLYLAYYKGRGIISHSPGADEVDVATRLRQDYNLENVYPVGRLDKDSEGLMIITNDGRITGPLLDPEAHHEKQYEVTVDKTITNQFIKKMAAGVTIEGYTTKPAVCEQKSPKRFLLTLTEGKKHQIRRMCAALGYQVESLKRIRIMNITLGALKPNQYRKISGSELQEFLAELL